MYIVAVVEYIYRVYRTSLHLTTVVVVVVVVMMMVVGGDGGGGGVSNNVCFHDRTAACNTWLYTLQAEYSTILSFGGV